MSSSIKVIQPSGILDGNQASEFRQEIAEAVQGGAGLLSLISRMSPLWIVLV